MPIYVYKTISKEGDQATFFEIQQSMKEAPLTHHPETGEPVRRVYQPPNLSVRYTPGDFKKKTEKGKLEKHGFTRYEKDKLTGRYHKTAGVDKRAPETFDPRAGLNS